MPKFFVNKECQCQKMQTLKGEAGKARLQTHDGAQFLVVPVVAIVEGILNNAFVPAEEFGRFVDAWEGRPVPVTHPEINGQHVSANKLDVKEKYVIGTFQNVEVDGDKLKGEMWIDVNKATKKGFSDLVKALKSGNVVEVSTAYFADEDPTSGTFNNQEYSSIHRNLRPDHLALLPNDIGACSVADGCGTFQNQFKQFSQTLIAQMKKIMGQSSEAKAMTKNQLVSAVIANKANSFSDNDKDALMAMEEEFLKKFLANEDTKDEETNADGEEEVPNPEDETPQNNKAKKGELSLNAEDKAALAFARKAYAGERDRLVAKLSVNKNCKFAKERLQAMTVEDLQALDASLNVHDIDFSGGGLRQPFGNATHTGEIQPLIAEPVVLAKKKAEGDK